MAGPTLDLPGFPGLVVSCRVGLDDRREDGRVLATAGGLSLETRDLAVRWTIDPVAGGVQLRGTIEAKRALRLDRLDLGFAGETLTGLSGARFYRHGYASWTPSLAMPANLAPPTPVSRSFAIANHPVDSPWYGRADGILGSLMGVLSWLDRALLLGFLTQNSGLGEIFLDHGLPPALHAGLDWHGKRLAAGQTLNTEPLLLITGDRLLSRYAELLSGGREIQRPSPVGWCSWYHLYTAVKPEDVARNAEIIAQWPATGASLVQLDDGYQAAVGDWNRMNLKFSRGLGPVARPIRDRGLQAGLWLAPFMAARRSRLARDHGDWVLRDGRGAAVSCGFNPAWKDWLVGLDLSHPGVLAWLDDTFRALVGDGFDYFKLDFLYAGLRRGARFNPGLSAVEAYRGGLAAIRAAVGADRFILGCGAPIGPSLGLVDAMRVSADVKEAWYPRFFGLLGQDCGVASLMESCRNNLTRAWQHRRLWLNDPDCLLVREQDTALGLDETRLLITIWAMTGGLMLLSDDLPTLSDDRRALLERVLPPGPLGASTPGLLSEDFPREFVLEGENCRLRAILNWEAHPEDFSLEEAPVYRFDQWELAPVEERRIWVPTHAVRAILETPRGDKPTPIGTDLHLLALVDGRISSRFVPSEAGGTLEIEGRQLAASAGSIWIAVPPGWTAAPDQPAVRVVPGGIVVSVARAAPWQVAVRFGR